MTSLLLPIVSVLLVVLAISPVRPRRALRAARRAAMLRAGRHKITGDVKLWIDGAPDKPVSHVVGSYMQIG